MSQDEKQLQINIVPAEVSVLNLKPGDRLAVKLPDGCGGVNRGEVRRIREYFERWAGVPVAVLVKGIELQVVRDESPSVADLQDTADENMARSCDL